MFLQSTDKIVGRYSIAKRDADSNVLEQYEFNNLIIPTTLAQAAQRRLIEVIELGSGVTPPTEQDSALSAPIGGQWIVAYKDTTAGFDLDTNQPTVSYNYYALIPEGIAISDIREFGMFDSNTSLFSRALLKAGDEQLTLSKGENEYIEIYYSVIFKLPLGVQPVKTMTFGDQAITVTSEAFANTVGIGRFDTETLIDGIYINESEVPALGHDFQPATGMILPVTLSPHQLLGRQDVNYISTNLTAPLSIYEIVVKSQLGWFSYKFSPALNLPHSAKWSLGFGVQWAQNTGAYTTPPQVFMVSVVDDIKLSPSIDIVSFNPGANF